MMLNRFSAHTRAVLQALFVTFLWSTSWVLIKFGLADIPPVTFAGLRYFLAFLALIPFYRRSARVTPLRTLSRRDWLNLAGLGLLYYTITQASQFMGLAYLPAITFSLLLNSTAIVVAVLAIPLLREIPTWLQWGMESSIINNTMLIQIAVLALLFLGETLTGVEVVGLLLAALGALLVQVRWRRRYGRIQPQPLVEE